MCWYHTSNSPFSFYFHTLYLNTLITFSLKPSWPPRTRSNSKRAPLWLSSSLRWWAPAGSWQAAERSQSCEPHPTVTVCFCVLGVPPGSHPDASEEYNGAKYTGGTGAGVWWSGTAFGWDVVCFFSSCPRYLYTDICTREMVIGNTFGATVLSSYGGFWAPSPSSSLLAGSKSCPPWRKQAARQCSTTLSPCTSAWAQPPINPNTSHLISNRITNP